MVKVTKFRKKLSYINLVLSANLLRKLTQNIQKQPQSATIFSNVLELYTKNINQKLQRNDNEPYNYLIFIIFINDLIIDVISINDEILMM